MRPLLSPNWLAILTLFLLAFGAIFLARGIWNNAGQSESSEFPGITLGLTAEARQSLQLSGEAFPSESAGLSAYYRLGSPGDYGLDKDKVDTHIFGPVPPNLVTPRAGPAVVRSMGANYTIATLPLLNIDRIPSNVNLYYDDQGWIVAYLPANSPSSQIWQAAQLDVENPSLSTVNHTLLDAINVVLEDALSGTAISDADLSYYHWQHEDVDQFLMIAATRDDIGTYPIAFTVPESFDIVEVSATMWIAQGSNTTAPCATLTLDSEDLIAKKCAKGLYHETVDLYNLGRQASHNFTLTQSDSDQGSSGALLMVIYSTP